MTRLIKTLPKAKSDANLSNARSRVRLLLAVAAIFFVLSVALASEFAVLVTQTVFATLLVLATGLWLKSMRRVTTATQRSSKEITTFWENDPIPSFCAASDGEILNYNAAAAEQFDVSASPALAGLLKNIIANPAGALFRLQSRAAASGNAHEEAVTKSGTVHLNVHQFLDDRFIWRIEHAKPQTPQRTNLEAQQLPMIMVGRTDAILFINDAARRLLGGRVKTLDAIFTELPFMRSALNMITTADGPQGMLVVELPAVAGRRAIYFLPSTKPAEGQDQWQASQELPVPMMKIAPNGSIQAYNRMAKKLVGNALDKEVHLAEVMEGLGRPISDWLSDALADRAVQKSEFLRLKRADAEVFIQVVLNRIVEDGHPALIAVMHDATELKSLEAKFVQSQKMQAIGQLAGGVAHDFNNLLTAITGHCDLLLLRHNQGDPDHSDLMQINQNANRAAALVGQLLAFSRKQTLRPETLDMRDTLSDLTHLLNRLVGEKITLTLCHDPILKPIRADKRQLEQVLLNLVVNARDAMPEGGEIRITTECATLSRPLVRDRATVPAGDYLTVEVSDKGMGIASDKLEKVFEPFFTTKRTGDGTGLGLSTAYGIVKQSGGFIFVDSVVGMGTTFVLYFPVLDVRHKVQPNAAPKADLPTLSTEEGVILLVEDEAPVRAFASRALRLRGFTVFEAESAEEALRTLEDGDLNIDVFVTDVVMPGMDGPSWVKKALVQRPGVRVVFVSGYAEDSFGEAQTKIPNSVFLPKPFSLSDLTETVQRQLH